MTTTRKGAAARLASILSVGLAAAAVSACPPERAPGDAAERVYVPPGEYDEFYAFLSGGFDGNMTVHGLPSTRVLKIVPVFSQFPANGYGYSEETRAMLNTTFGFVPWDDLHHVVLSMTDGVPDGRWVFGNANNTPRIARVDLTTFHTTEIVQIPNTAGNHASPFVTQNTEYVVAATRFSVPIPQEDVPIASYAERFGGTISFLRADQPGQMDIAFQLLLPPFNYDLAQPGLGPSAEWAFFTSYNTEMAYTLLEVEASQREFDFIAAVNWRTAERCAAEDRGTVMQTTYVRNFFGEDRIARSEEASGVRVLTHADCPGMVYLLPTPKSPHGVDVDPTGEYIVAGGKLATVIPVHSFSRMIDAIEAQAFDGDFQGIPILRYDAIVAGEVQEPGLGPLHTEFDGEGNAYTTMFISSEVVKWRLGTWDIVDRASAYYSPGHLMVPGGNSRQPWGRYLVVMNKITRDRYLPMGPEVPNSGQLFDISGERMELLMEFPLIGEPHYAQALPADLVADQTLRIYDLRQNPHPYATRSEAAARVEREGSVVRVMMTAIRSHFVPDNIEGVQVGDTVYFHVTNIEQDWDIAHGFAAMGAQTSNILIMPGETLTLRWVPQAPGIYPFYCTDFCSALHQEMQGYVRVSAAGEAGPLRWGTGRTAPGRQDAAGSPRGGPTPPAAGEGETRR